MAKEIEPTATARCTKARTEAEWLAFKAGGWLSLANRMKMTPESLKEHFRRGASEAEEWLEIVCSITEGG